MKNFKWKSSPADEWQDIEGYTNYHAARAIAKEAHSREPYGGPRIYSFLIANEDLSSEERWVVYLEYEPVFTAKLMEEV